MHITHLGSASPHRVIVNKKHLNLQKTTTGVLSALLLIYALQFRWVMLYFATSEHFEELKKISCKNCNIFVDFVSCVNSSWHFCVHDMYSSTRNTVYQSSCSTPHFRDLYLNRDQENMYRVSKLMGNKIFKIETIFNIYVQYPIQ